MSSDVIIRNECPARSCEVCDAMKCAWCMCRKCEKCSWRLERDTEDRAVKREMEHRLNELRRAMGMYWVNG